MRTRRLLLRTSVLGWSMVLVMAATAFATPGVLDSSYSGDGIKQGSFYERGNQVLVDAQGRVTVGGIVAPGRKEGGHTSLVRYLSNGALDTTFSADGRLALVAEGVARGLAFWNGGVIVTTPHGLWGVRANGALDSSFGLGGRVDFPAGRRALGRHPLTVVGGRAYVILDDPHTTGSYLYAFSRDGTMSSVWRSDLEMRSVVVSHLIAYGMGAIDDRVALARFTIGPPMTIDASYGRGGLAYGPALEFDPYGKATAYTANDLALHPASGKVTVAGDKYDCWGGDCSSYYYGFALRFLQGGALDATFGTGGEVRAGCTNGSTGNNSVALQGDKVILAGESWDKWDDYTARFGVTRLTATGERDATFAQSACTTYGTEGATVGDMAFTGSTIVVAGGQFTARYLAT